MDERITKYELTRLLGARALQLASGAPILVKLTEKELTAIGYNTIEIAKLEFDKGVIPMTIRKQKPKVALIEEN